MKVKVWPGLLRRRPIGNRDNRNIRHHDYSFYGEEKCRHCGVDLWAEAKRATPFCIHCTTAATIICPCGEKIRLHPRYGLHSGHIRALTNDEWKALVLTAEFTDKRATK